MNLSVVMCHLSFPNLFPGWHSCQLPRRPYLNSWIFANGHCRYCQRFLHPVRVIGFLKCFIIIVITRAMFITIKNIVITRSIMIIPGNFLIIPRYSENSPNYSGIFSDSFPHLLCSKLCRHNRRMPIWNTHQIKYEMHTSDIFQNDI